MCNAAMKAFWYQHILRIILPFSVSNPPKVYFIFSASLISLSDMIPVSCKPGFSSSTTLPKFFAQTSVTWDKPYKVMRSTFYRRRRDRKPKWSDWHLQSVLDRTRTFLNPQRVYSHLWTRRLGEILSQPCEDRYRTQTGSLQRQLCILRTSAWQWQRSTYSVNYLAVAKICSLRAGWFRRGFGGLEKFGWKIVADAKTQRLEEAVIDTAIYIAEAKMVGLCRTKPLFYNDRRRLLSSSARRFPMDALFVLEACNKLPSLLIELMSNSQLATTCCHGFPHLHRTQAIDRQRLATLCLAYTSVSSGRASTRIDWRPSIWPSVCHFLQSAFMARFYIEGCWSSDLVEKST